MSNAHNYLSNIEFRFSIKRLPNTSYHIQRASLPGLNLNPINYPTPLKMTQVYGDSLDYDQLQIEFLVDEDMSNWYEIFSWIKGITAPENTEQFFAYEDRLYYSDATLTVLSSAKNPNIEFGFTDLHPVSLAAVQFDATTNDSTPVQAQAAFSFTSMTYRKL